VAFTEFDRSPNFVPDDILIDVVPYSQTHGNLRSSRMNYVRDGSATNLMGQYNQCFFYCFFFQCINNTMQNKKLIRVLFGDFIYNHNFNQTHI